MCDCIMTTARQWDELFRLQYPHQAVPEALGQSAAVAGSSDEGLNDEIASNELDVRNTTELTTDMPSLQEHTITDSPSHWMEPSAPLRHSVAAENIQIDLPSFIDVHTLRQQMYEQEQRISRQSERESDLEMVLGNVWQALVRSGSSDAQPDSPLWRLVARFAKNMLSTTSGSSSTSNQQAGSQLTEPPASIETLDWSSWVNDWSFIEPHTDLHSES